MHQLPPMKTAAPQILVPLSEAEIDLLRYLIHHETHFHRAAERLETVRQLDTINNRLNAYRLELMVQRQ